jgi:hypothetical protein
MGIRFECKTELEVSANQLIQNGVSVEYDKQQPWLAEVPVAELVAIRENFYRLARRPDVKYVLAILPLIEAYGNWVDECYNTEGPMQPFRILLG